MDKKSLKKSLNQKFFSPNFIFFFTQNFFQMEITGFDEFVGEYFHYKSLCEKYQEEMEIEVKEHGELKWIAGELKEENLKLHDRVRRSEEHVNQLVQTNQENTKAISNFQTKLDERNAELQEERQQRELLQAKLDSIKDLIQEIQEEKRHRKRK